MDDLFRKFCTIYRATKLFLIFIKSWSSVSYWLNWCKISSTIKWMFQSKIKWPNWGTLNNTKIREISISICVQHIFLSYISSIHTWCVDTIQSSPFIANVSKQIVPANHKTSINIRTFKYLACFFVYQKHAYMKSKTALQLMRPCTADTSVPVPFKSLMSALRYWRHDCHAPSI